MEEELNIRSAEEKAMKEAEYIAASESIKLIQELSLRLETSEPNSKNTSRSPSIVDINDNSGNEEKPEGLSDQTLVTEEKAAEEKIVEEEEKAVEEEEKAVEEEEKAAEEEEKIVEEEEKIVEEELASQTSNPQEPIIEIRDDESESQIFKQESKLILSEFKDDSVSFKEEQQETNEHSDDSEVVVLEELLGDQGLDQNEDSETQVQLIDSKEPLEVEGCVHKMRGISDSTKSSISGIIEFRMSLFDNCKGNASSMNTQLKKSSWDYFDSLHSKLIKFAGFHSPDECSICKDFKHQDVPLLN